MKVVLKLLKTRLTNFENIYRQKVIAHVLLGDSNIDEKQLEKDIAELDETVIKDKFTTSYLVKNLGRKYGYNNLLEKVRIISIDDLENILNEKLVNTHSDILKDYFIEKTGKYDSEQLEICRQVLLELINKVSEVSAKNNLQAKRYIKKLVDVFDHSKIKMYLDKEDGEYDNIEELKIDSIDRQVYKKSRIY